MSNWNDDESYEAYMTDEWYEETDETYQSYSAKGKGKHRDRNAPTGFNPHPHQMTTKVPPTFDGTSSWFTYEELIDDWLDVTELDPEKHGPALKHALIKNATVHKPLLDRDKLKDKESTHRMLCKAIII